MLEYRFDTQLLIEGTDLDEDVIHDYLLENIPGDCLLVVGDEELISSTTTPIFPGRCWNTAPPWGTSTTSLWRIWTGRRGDSTGKEELKISDWLKS